MTDHRDESRPRLTPSPRMPKLRAITLSILLVLATCATAHAADGEGTALSLEEPPVRAAGQAGASGGGLVRTIVGLAVVIGVIYGLTWVLRQLKRSREATASGTNLATLATLPLGPNRSLHLVRAGDEVVLLGYGEGGVTTIRTYGEDEAARLGLLDDAAGDAPRGLPAPTPDLPGITERPRRRGLLAELRRRTVIR